MTAKLPEYIRLRASKEMSNRIKEIMKETGMTEGAIVRAAVADFVSAWADATGDPVPVEERGALEDAVNSSEEILKRFARSRPNLEIWERMLRLMDQMPARPYQHLEAHQRWIQSDEREAAEATNAMMDWRRRAGAAKDHRAKAYYSQLAEAAQQRVDRAKARIERVTEAAVRIFGQDAIWQIRGTNPESVSPSKRGTKRKKGEQSDG